MDYGLDAQIGAPAPSRDEAHAATKIQVGFNDAACAAQKRDSDAECVHTRVWSEWREGEGARMSSVEQGGRKKKKK